MLGVYFDIVNNLYFSNLAMKSLDDVTSGHIACHVILKYESTIFTQ